MTSYVAVVDTSTVYALVRGGIFAHLTPVFQPVLMGRRAARECQSDARVNVALNQAIGSAWLTVVSLITRSRVYDPNLSAADIEGIEVALDHSAVLLTQDDLQRVEALSAGVTLVLHTFDLLAGFKHLGRIPLVRPVLEQMEQNGEQYLKHEKNKLLRSVNEPLFP